MIRVTVLYPDAPGKKFDLDYYAKKHMELVRQRLSDAGLVRIEVDKGVASVEQGKSAPFLAIGFLYFNSLTEYQRAFAAHSEELMGDIPNYTNIEPYIQISEILE
jgi:uncharacterized protein (TIGR02118 family)